jgi:putative membrane protein
MRLCGSAQRVRDNPKPVHPVRSLTELPEPFYGTFPQSMITRRLSVPIHGTQVLAALVLTTKSNAAEIAGHHALEPWQPTWSFEPWILACLATTTLLYAIGVFRLWMRAGAGRGVSIRQVAAFCGGLLSLVVALLSPLDSLGDYLFSAHMAQHETLMLVAAPLLVLGRPLSVWTWALPFEWRRSTGQFFHQPAWRVPWLIITGPLVAWLLHALALWLWHVPAFFEAALANEAVHAFQHITFLLTALLFWWSVLGASTKRDKGIALVSVFTTFVHTGALGALLTLSHTPWYPSYDTTAPTLNLTALADQQLGGLIMWIPAGAIYLLSGLALASKWLDQ